MRARTARETARTPISGRCTRCDRPCVPFRRRRHRVGCGRRHQPRRSSGVERRGLHRDLRRCAQGHHRFERGALGPPSQRREQGAVQGEGRRQAQGQALVRSEPQRHRGRPVRRCQRQAQGHRPLREQGDLAHLDQDRRRPAISRTRAPSSSRSSPPSPAPRTTTARRSRRCTTCSPTPRPSTCAST